MEISLDKMKEQDIVKILFAENPGILVQVKDKKAFEKLMEEAGVGCAVIAKPTDERHILVEKKVFSIISVLIICVMYGTSLLINWISSRAVAYVPETVSKTIRCSRWNSSTTRTYR